MNNHLSNISRRCFIRSLALSAAGVALRPRHACAADVDPDRIALVSDTHIAADLDKIVRQIWKMADNFKSVTGEICALEPRPAAVVVNGDIALQDGQPGDYRSVAGLLEPFRAAKLPLCFTLGNHDNREEFCKALPALVPKDNPVEGKLVRVIELKRANLFLLDSLDPMPGTPGGKLGEAQLKWLASALDARAKKPAIVLAHHNLQWAPDAKGRYSGLADTAALWGMLRERKQVKAYVHGHSHVWKTEPRDEMHIIGLPATAYNFKKEELVGWMDAKLKDDGIALTQRALDPAHPKHGQTTALTWLR
ncbi:MAG: metallophosphoesterase [Verrucomicrobia bacterium]|nr:metallophosphoesterase [Verrucomicrobiota bacterium]